MPNLKFICGVQRSIRHLLANMPKFQTVFITGASGFVGQNLVKRFSKESNYNLLLLVRSISKANKIFPDAILKSNQITFLEGSLEDLTTKQFQTKNWNLLQNITQVIHLAAEMDFYPTKSELLFKVNVEGTKSVLNLCEEIINENKNQFERFIYCSSTEVIGPSNRNGKPRFPATEETSNEPSYVYGETKIQAENLVRYFALQHNKLSIILRPTGIYGPGDTFSIFELQKMIEYGLLFFIPGNGSAKLMYTHIDDVVEGFYISSTISNEIPTESSSTTIILCPDEPLTYEEWIRHLSKLIGRSDPKFHIPFPLVKLATFFMSFFMNIGKQKQFMYRAKTIDRMAEDRWYSNKKAKNVLGFYPKYSLKDGLTQTVNYNIKNGFIKRKYLSHVAIISIAVCFFLFFICFLFIMSPK